MKPTYDQLENELRESLELIEAIRTGQVDSVRGDPSQNVFFRLERLEVVEERNRQLQETKDALAAEKELLAVTLASIGDGVYLR